MQQYPQNIMGLLTVFFAASHSWWVANISKFWIQIFGCCVPLNLSNFMEVILMFIACSSISIFIWCPLSSILSSLIVSLSLFLSFCIFSIILSLLLLGAILSCCIMIVLVLRFNVLLIGSHLNYSKLSLVFVFCLASPPFITDVNLVILGV